MNKFKRITGILFLAFAACQSPEPKKPIDLLELSISEIHEAYQQGTFNSQQLVSAYLERIETFDEKINSLRI
jgi:amidase